MLWVRMVLRAVFLVPCLSAIWFYWAAISGARDLFSGPEKRKQDDFCPPVSILKPLCGFDKDTYENLASFCRQDYPEYQIVFGVRDREDPSVEVVERIIRDFPRRDIRLVVDGRMLGASPKVSNLANMQREAKYPFLLVSDGDIRVGEDYMKRVTRPARDPAVGVVTCMHRSLSKGLAATIEALRISTDFCAGLLVARKLEGVKFALGSTTLVRKEALDKIGGFPALADYLADDFMLGNWVGKAGYTVVLSDYVVEHALATRSLRDLIHREIRWNRGMRISRPWGYLGLIFTQGVPMSLLFLSLTARFAFGWVVLSATWGARLVMGQVVGSRYLKDRAARKYLWLVPLADLIGFVPWCYSLFGNTVEWRAQRFHLTPLGKMVPVPAGSRARWLPHQSSVLLAPLFAVLLVVGLQWNHPAVFRSSPKGGTVIRLPESGLPAIPPPPILSASSARPVKEAMPKQAVVLLNGLWNHIDILGGISSFGAFALSRDAFDKEEGSRIRHRQLGAATQSALLVAWGLGLWKQWHQLSALAAAPSGKEPWKFQVDPAFDQGRLTFVATLRRRF